MLFAANACGDTTSSLPTPAVRSTSSAPLCVPAHSNLPRFPSSRNPQRPPSSRWTTTTDLTITSSGSAHKVEQTSRPHRGGRQRRRGVAAGVGREQHATRQTHARVQVERPWSLRMLFYGN